MYAGRLDADVYVQDFARINALLQATFPAGNVPVSIGPDTSDRSSFTTIVANAKPHALFVVKDR